VNEVICEEKHMGSRAVVLLTRNPDRFDAPSGWRGTVHTRTGRPFFSDELADTFLARLDAAFDSAGLWSELDSDWVMLDAELLPWSLKADDMIREQYASVGAAGTAALPKAVHVLEQAAASGIAVGDLLDRTTSRLRNVEGYVRSYRNYAAPSEGLTGVQLAPFQVLATEGSTYSDRGHDWHLSVADRLAAVDPEFVRPTKSMIVTLDDPESVDAATGWWESLTAAGGEGMVVKPLANLVRGPKGLVQPGIKVRGREYLRIIYGPDYTEPSNLARLRDRNLAHKRSMALREYALGVEGLERLAAGAPLWKIHQAVFAVLAMESEPVDPRL
jgi:hypothetical protein